MKEKTRKLKNRSEEFGDVWTYAAIERITPSFKLPILASELRLSSTPHSWAKGMRARQGFTLVELVVVILVLGIIAAVAAPKMFDTAGEASLNTAKQDLAVIRDAIELHRVQIGVFPGDAGTQGDFNNDLNPFLRAKIKKCPVGNSSASVRVESSGLPLVVSGGQGWAYDSQTGQFIINHADYSDL